MEINHYLLDWYVVEFLVWVDRSWSIDLNRVCCPPWRLGCQLLGKALLSFTSWECSKSKMLWFLMWWYHMNSNDIISYRTCTSKVAKISFVWWVIRPFPFWYQFLAVSAWRASRASIEADHKSKNIRGSSTRAHRTPRSSALAFPNHSYQTLKIKQKSHRSIMISPKALKATRTWRNHQTREQDTLQIWDNDYICVYIYICIYIYVTI